MKWTDVIERHGTMSGVNIRHGDVVSLLCGSGDHPDAVSDNTVLYSIPRRPFYLPTVKALESCAARNTVFFKVKKNNWKDLGLFRVTTVTPRERDVLFTLMAHKPTVT